jgi:hypothetical protein
MKRDYWVSIFVSGGLDLLDDPAAKLGIES